MKKLKRLLATVLAATTAVVPFAACGGDPAQNSSTDIQVYFWKSGLGTDFIENIAESFNATQSEYTVTVETGTANQIIKTLELGKNNTYDLYFTMLNTYQYNDDFAKLDDVLDSKAEGESLTIRQKYYDYLLNGVKEADGTTRFLTYGNGWCGIAYNADYIDGTTYKVPRTTKELESLTATFAALHAQDGSKPYPWILYSDTNNNGYWNYSVMTWEAQYDGLDYYYNNMLALKDENGNSPSREVFEKKDGRYKALEVVESLLTPDTVSRSSTGTFTDAQAVYLDGGAIMMVNGNWLMNESTGTKKNVKMMRFPVISSIVEKLENTSMSDSTLAAIIDEVDAGKEESELCSASDFAKIKEARTIMYNNSSEQYVFIPEYSPAKEGAKEFLKYFYSDKGIAAYNRATKLPASARLVDSSAFDASAIPEWNKQQFDFAENLTAITNTMTKSRLFINSSTNQFASLAFADKVWTTNTAARKDAEALWSDILSIIKENWSEWSKNV